MSRHVLRFVRIWLPVIVVGAGLLVIALDPTVDGLEGAAHIIGAGLAIWLLNLLIRVGMSGDRDRDQEDAARAFFDAHGRWPDDPAPPVPVPAPAPAHPPRRAQSRPRTRG